MEVSHNAISKVFLHCVKYPHLSVFGILLGKPSSNINEAIPLFHGPFLAPMFETAMKLVRSCFK